MSTVPLYSATLHMILLVHCKMLLCFAGILHCCIDTSAALPRLPFTGIQDPRATSARPAKTSWALTAAPGNKQGSPEEALNEPKAIICCALMTSSLWDSLLPSHRLRK